MCSCRSTTWTWDWVWLYDWFVFFFWSHPFPFQKRGKQPLKLTTWFLVVCFSHKITPWSQPRHLFTTLYLDVSIPALGAHTRQRKRMDHLWRWRFVVYGYQMILDDMDIDGWNRWWKVKACYESSLTKHLPHRFALTGLVWSWHLLNISRFSILWICWWRDFSRSWMWFRSVAPCRIVISISGVLHFLFSYLFIPSIWILYINRMNRPRSRVRTWIFRCPRSSGSEFSRMARDCGWMEERFVDKADSILQPGWHVCFLH